MLPGNEFECVSVLQGHTQDVKMVQWHPTMDVLFSCSYDNSVKVENTVLYIIYVFHLSSHKLIELILLSFKSGNTGH